MKNNDKKLENVNEESLKAVSGGATLLGAAPPIAAPRAPAFDMRVLKGGFQISHW